MAGDLLGDLVGDTLCIGTSFLPLVGDLDGDLALETDFGLLAISTSTGSTVAKPKPSEGLDSAAYLGSAGISALNIFIFSEVVFGSAAAATFALSLRRSRPRRSSFLGVYALAAALT